MLNSTISETLGSNFVIRRVLLFVFSIYFLLDTRKVVFEKEIISYFNIFSKKKNDKPIPSECLLGFMSPPHWTDLRCLGFGVVKANQIL